ncbi:inverse autotransporter beta domain-containing protein [Salmonella enterica subsp. arizonae serovar 35:z4,z32:-]|nr:inverse autotransporter beta domain-containing protein [Salmonella enterica subsp. arizonae serovar 35:z4,z32:-]
MQGIFGDGEADRQRNPHAIALGLNYPPVPLVTIGVNQRMGQNCLQFNPLRILSVTRLIVLHSPSQQIAQQRKWLLLTVKNQ